MQGREGRVCLERNADLLQDVIEGGVTRRRISLLDIDLNLDGVLIVGTAEGAQRLLGLAGITAWPEEAWFGVT